MTKFKKMKLVSKLTIITAAVLTIIFAILISFSVLFTKNIIGNSTFAELTALSNVNSTQVQNIIENATDVAGSMGDYLINSYENATNAAENMENSSFKSAVFNTEISLENYETEKFILDTAKNTAKNNKYITSISVMFEPYKFDKNIKDYSFYINNNNLNSINSLGNYSDYSQQVYYKKAAEEKNIICTEPYKFEGNYFISVAFPIIYNNELKGVVSTDIDITKFNNIISQSDRYKSMYTTIYTPDGIIIYDSEDSKNVGVDMSQFFINQNELNTVKQNFGGNDAFTIQTQRENGEKVIRFYNPIKIGDTNWWSLIAVSLNDMNKDISTTGIILTIISISSLILIIFIITLFLKKLLKPIESIVKAAKDISKGNFDIHLTAQSEDEIGILTTTFDNTAKILKTIITDISYVLNNIAKQNLNINTSANYMGDLKEIEISLNNIIENLNNVMHNIHISSNNVAMGSEQVSSGAQALAQGATEQASSIEELSASITEIADKVKNNAENASTADKISREANEHVVSGNTQMKNMVISISEINKKSNEIVKIIKTIEDIAFQTNILALNAAVEAARAGTAGKGFAVVADEVRNLASKTSEAVKDTTVLIQETILAVEQGTQIADKTAESMELVVKGTNKVSSIINEIVQSSNEQANAISQITQGIDQISSVVQTNSATAEQSAATSEELSGQSQILSELVDKFKIKDI